MSTSDEEKRIAQKITTVFDEYIRDCQYSLEHADLNGRLELRYCIGACRELRRRVAAIITGEITQDMSPPGGPKR